MDVKLRNASFSQYSRENSYYASSEANSTQIKTKFEKSATVTQNPNYKFPNADYVDVDLSNDISLIHSIDRQLLMCCEQLCCDRIYIFLYC